MLSMLGSLYLAISGSTVLNMYIDCDIDARMPRTIERPLPAKVLRPLEALTFWIVDFFTIIWAFSLNTLFGIVVMAGLCCHAFVYSLWLKRQTPFQSYREVWPGHAGIGWTCSGYGHH